MRPARARPWSLRGAHDDRRVFSVFERDRQVHIAHVPVPKGPPRDAAGSALMSITTTALFGCRADLAETLEDRERHRLVQAGRNRWRKRTDMVVRHKDRPTRAEPVDVVGVFG